MPPISLWGERDFDWFFQNQPLSLESQSQQALRSYIKRSIIRQSYWLKKDKRRHKEENAQNANDDSAWESKNSGVERVNSWFLIECIVYEGTISTTNTYFGSADFKRRCNNHAPSFHS